MPLPRPLLATAVALASLAAACLDERPLVVTGRGAAGGAAAPLPPVPQELRPLDGPACLRCAAAVAAGMPAASACTSDGSPSSSERLAAYFDCACRAQCIEACALHCEGAPPDATCAACTAGRCAAASQQCAEGGT
jgi:hypothetical protein